MRCLYELRAYFLLINEKAWEIIVKIVNPIGMYDIHDTFPAAAVLQFIMTEIHLTSQLGRAEILSRATLAFSKVVNTHDTAEEMIQDIQTIKELLEQTTTYSVQSVGLVLLNKIVECLQIASQVGTVPAYVNLQRYSMMIAGVEEISKMDHESSQYSSPKCCSPGSVHQEFQHTKARQNVAVSLGTLTTSQAQITHFCACPGQRCPAVQASGRLDECPAWTGRGTQRERQGEVQEQQEAEGRLPFCHRSPTAWIHHQSHWSTGPPCSPLSPGSWPSD
jgi:hypothetical protein